MEHTQNKFRNLLVVLRNRALLIVGMIAVFVLGFWLRGWFSPVVSDSSSTSTSGGEQTASAKQQLWTCSMHPEIQLPKPGLCPKCHMDLIPLEIDDSEGMTSMRQLVVSENALKLMDVATVPVERKFVTATVRMVGKVDYDETRLAYITSWVPGRLDRLFVDYTGVPVKKGDHLVSLYSPELIGAQEELIQALQAVKNIQETELNIMRESTEAMVGAARAKLRLWGLTPAQITEIETTGKVADHLTIYAPAGGIVIHKNALEGMYVKEGSKIYTIADLSQVWVKLDAYESDLEWLRYGQKVEFTTVAYPGEIFTGTISFIDPVLTEKTRTVKIRVNVPNANGKLKPQMFVEAAVQAQVAGGGRIMDANLVDKWMCPMHPDVIKDTSGQCDICDMPLVRTESLGYVSDDPALAEKPLVIPVSAALVTGTRAIVYVAKRDGGKLMFEGREIVLGPRAGKHYLVRSGLQEGELVVVKGNFKIDSALQILAKPSMMMPQGGGGHDHGDAHVAKATPTVNDAFRVQLAKVFEGYFSVQQALANDDLEAAKKAAQTTLTALKAVDMKLVTGDNHVLWMKNSAELVKILSLIAQDKDIKILRESFYQLSQQAIALTKHFGALESKPYYMLHCPMAFDNRGANWLQTNDQTLNPYFGEMMLRCGGVEEVISPKAIWTKVPVPGIAN
jgi:membrane fusion protein, copper/silver efflux system